MGFDLIDRRSGRRSGSPSADDSAASTLREWVWRSYGGIEEGPGELPDEAAAHLLIEAAAERLTGMLERPTSRRVMRFEAEDGPTELVVSRITRSRRYGAQADPQRNIRAYLLAEVLGLSLAELGDRMGITRYQARQAKLSGAASVAKIARSRTDPRRPSVAGRPIGRNERAW